jgi:hypothetical protein
MADPKDRLIFCRTPLQSLIVSEIQRLHPARDTIVYQATSASDKHRHYYDRLEAESKLFIAWNRPLPSDTLNELFSYFSVPRAVRRRRFSAYLVSSFDSLVFSLLSARAGGDLMTYDDGTMYLLPFEMDLRLNYEGAVHALIKLIAGGRRNRQIIDRSSTHFSIYDPDHSLVDQTKVVKIDLFRGTGSAAAEGKEITVLLGAPVAIFPGETTEEMLASYTRLVTEFPREVFIPHPAEPLQPEVRPDLRNSVINEELISRSIAEDVLLHLVNAGYRLAVYGIASSTLLNVAEHARVFNVIIPGVNDRDVEVFERIGVESVAIHVLFQDQLA